jgi:RimJ/RimL family protein N-acetyltransferase
MFHPHYVTLKDGRAALIRSVEAADAEALIAHVNEVGAEQVYIMTERLRLTVGEEEDMIRRLDPRRTLFLIALVDRKLVASADVERGRQTKNAHTASLGISVHRSVRGVGLGKAMMGDLLRWAKDEGVRKLTLSVFATNGSAITLYRELGFSEEGRLRGQVVLQGQPVDEVLMARWL